MKPAACLEVANKSRRQAEFYFQKGNVGRAFAHFLVALKLCPSWKVELSQQFVSALCMWGETLDQEQRHKDLFNCYEQALEVFPNNEEVLNNLGSHLYRWGHTLEACNYFRKAVACNPEYLPAVRNLQGCCNLLVERWHYRMLNDSIRNDAYRAAITRKVMQQGDGSSVLDIGTGSGLLSLFAAEAGAEHVFACDYSPSMIHIASQVLEANGAGKKVTLINKMSNDIIIPTDMPTRVSLVVTETVDAGLLGEGILQSLIHAWEHLLVPSEPADVRVVPEAATVWMVPIECLHIARKYRVLRTRSAMNEMQIEDETVCQQNDFDFSKLQFITKQDEPYDTEDLNKVPGGYRFLAKPSSTVSIRFNNCKDMSNWLNGEKQVELWFECTEPGHVDAVVAWFDLNLDDIITLSSTPYSECDREDFHKASCWDQAVFPVQYPIFFKHKDKLKITVSCRGGKIAVNVSDYKQNDIMNTLEQALHSNTISAPKSDIITFSEGTNGCDKILVIKTESQKDKEVIGNVDNEEVKLEDETADNEVILSGTKETCGLVFDDTVSAVMLQEAVRFLNDTCWMNALENTAKHLCQEPKFSQISSVLDLCPFPVLGLHLVKKRNARLTCVSNCSTEDVIRRLSKLNDISADRIQCVDEKHLSEFLQESNSQFDIIMVHPIDQTGEFKEYIFSILTLLRSSLAKGGILLPQHILVRGQLLESDWLKQVSHVKDNSRTCGFNIASFINIFQVPQHLDLNLSTLDAVLLSKPDELFCISLNTETNNITQTLTIPATRAGKASALAYWYDILIQEAVGTVSTLHHSSHISQTAILFEPCISVRKQQSIKLQIRFCEGLIHVEPLRNEDHS